MTVPPLPSWAAPKQAGAPSPDSPLDRLYGAFVGPRWDVYRRKFRPFFDDPRFVPTWNWAAALTTFVGPFWFLYRKLYVPAVFFWMFPSLVLSLLWSGPPVTMADVFSDSPTGQDVRLLVAGVQLSTVILAGGTANFLLFRRAQAAIRLVRSRGADETQALPLLSRVGRVNVVAALVGLGLAVFAVAAMQSGLR